jgi:hypothetical protein
MYRKRMHLLFAVLAVLATSVVHGQGNPGFKKTAAPPRTILEVSPSAIETNLVQGRLIMTKSLNKGEGSSFIASYVLTWSNTAGFNSRKPIKIKLDEASFDAVFRNGGAEFSKHLEKMTAYVQEKKLNLTEEKAWVELITYFNGL